MYILYQIVTVVDLYKILVYTIVLEKRGLKKYWLRQNGINPKVVDALKNNKNVNVSTILELCRLLDCQPGDLFEYIPDDLSDTSNI